VLRQFLKDSLIYSVSAALSRGMAIILVPVYTRFLQPSEYGALDLLMVFATVANYLVALEISQGLARVYSDAKTPAERSAYVSSALWFAMAGYAVFIAIALPGAPALSSLLLDSPSWEGAVRAMLLAFGLNGLFFLLQDLLRWQLQPLRHAVASVTYTAVSTAVGIAWLVWGEAGVSGILYGQCAGAVAGIAAAWIGGAAAQWTATFRAASWLEMARYSAPQVISSVAAYFCLYTDRLLIKELMSLDDVGIYGVGARVASVVALLMTGFQSGLIPIVFRHHAEPESPIHMARVLRYFLALAFAILMVLAAFSGELVRLFTTPQYYGAADVVPLLGAALMLSGMFIFVPGIFIARRTGLVALINVAAVLLNIGGSVLLIPLLGTLGAATATLAASLVAFLLYVYANRVFYPIPFEWGRIIGAALLAAALAAALVGMQHSGWPYAATLGARIALTLAGAATVAVLLIGKNELASAISRRLAS
jgi:O-antigen/teichoic acid export membrane protein